MQRMPPHSQPGTKQATAYLWGYLWSEALCQEKAGTFKEEKMKMSPEIIRITRIEQIKAGLMKVAQKHNDIMFYVKDPGALEENALGIYKERFGE